MGVTGGTPLGFDVGAKGAGGTLPGLDLVSRRPSGATSGPMFTAGADSPVTHQPGAHAVAAEAALQTCCKPRLSYNADRAFSQAWLI